MKRIITQRTSWDSPSIFLTQPTNRVEWYVLGTPSSPEPQYLILSPYSVPTMEDTSSTTTTGLIHPILLGIPHSPIISCVNWKYMVRKFKIFSFEQMMIKHLHIKSFVFRRTGLFTYDLFISSLPAFTNLIVCVENLNNNKYYFCWLFCNVFFRRLFTRW